MKIGGTGFNLSPAHFQKIIALGLAGSVGDYIAKVFRAGESGPEGCGWNVPS
jgi:hypothetical protein